MDESETEANELVILALHNQQDMDDGVRWELLQLNASCTFSMDRKRSQTDRPFFIHSMQVQLVCSKLHPFWYPLERKSFLLNLPFFPELKNCCMCFLHHAKIYRLQTLKASSDHVVCNLKDLQITDLKKLHGGHVVCNICKVFCMKLAILVDEFKTAGAKGPSSSQLLQRAREMSIGHLYPTLLSYNHLWSHYATRLCPTVGLGSLLLCLLKAPFYLILFVFFVLGNFCFLALCFCTLALSLSRQSCVCPILEVLITKPKQRTRLVLMQSLFVCLY